MTTWKWLVLLALQVVGPLVLADQDVFGRSFYGASGVLVSWFSVWYWT